MGRKVNPRRVPRTQRDVDDAYNEGISEGLNRGIELMLYALIDKHDAPMDDVQQLARELSHAAECVAGGYITWADIRTMLKEYDVGGGTAMKIPNERPIETVRAWLTSEASVPANVYSGILLLIEFAEAHERANDLREELT